MALTDQVRVVRMYIEDHKGAGYLEALTYLNNIEEALYRLEDLDK